MDDPLEVLSAKLAEVDREIAACDIAVTVAKQRRIKYLRAIEAVRLADGEDQRNGDATRVEDMAMFGADSGERPSQLAAAINIVNAHSRPIHVDDISKKLVVLKYGGDWKVLRESIRRNLARRADAGVIQKTAPNTYAKVRGDQIAVL